MNSQQLTTLRFKKLADKFIPTSGNLIHASYLSGLIHGKLLVEACSKILTIRVFHDYPLLRYLNNRGVKSHPDNERLAKIGNVDCIEFGYDKQGELWFRYTCEAIAHKLIEVDKQTVIKLIDTITKL